MRRTRICAIWSITMLVAALVAVTLVSVLALRRGPHFLGTPRMRNGVPTTQRHRVGLRVLSTSAVSSPTVLVAIANASRSAVYVAWAMAQIDADNNPLSARVVDAESGHEVDTRLARTLLMREPCETDFLRLGPGHWYGTEIDLRDYYALERGHRYRVTFRYSTMVPPRVGPIRPWQGQLTSETILVAVP